MDDEVRCMRAVFDSVPQQKRPLDGLMGNAEANGAEIEALKAVLGRVAFSSKGHMLDAGCGIGRLFPLWQEMGFDAISGVDFSPRMLEEARKSPGVECYEADLSALPFADDHFDVTFAVYALVHIMDDERHDRCVRELERVTRRELVVVQDMDARKVRQEFPQVKIREVFDLLNRFKHKMVRHFYKEAWTVPIGDGEAKVSVLVMDEPGKGWA